MLTTSHTYSFRSYQKQYSPPQRYNDRGLVKEEYLVTVFSITGGRRINCLLFFHHSLLLKAFWTFTAFWNFFFFFLFSQKIGSDLTFHISVVNLNHYENTPIQIYCKLNNQKREKIPIKNSDIFHISAQNIDCGYSLEPPRRGGSNEYPQSMFLSRNKKNNVYPCKPQFYYIKGGLKGVKII